MNIYKSGMIYVKRITIVFYWIKASYNKWRQVHKALSLILYIIKVSIRIC